jgi:PAS domain S-box-containing protein
LLIPNYYLEQTMLMTEYNSLTNLENLAEELLKILPIENVSIFKNGMSEFINQFKQDQADLNIKKEAQWKSSIELQNKYNALFDFSPLGYFIIDHNGLIIHANTSAANLLGLKKDSLFDKMFSRYIAPDSQKDFSQFQSKALKLQSLQKSEIKIMKRKNSIFYAQIHGKSIINALGKNELLIIINKASNLKQSEDLAYSHPTDGIMYKHELSLTFVKEMNEPISIISNFLHGCIHRLETGNFKPENLLQSMRQATEQLHRTSEVILHMKNFACKGILNYELVNLDTLIKDIIALTKKEIEEYPVEINYRPMNGLPKIMLDRIYIQHAILNLARNAIEAMREGSIAYPKLIIEINRPSKEIIEINIIDNGPAFKLETAHQLFDPHYTTKPYGIGLGLITSRHIVESHGGKLCVELYSTCGACFKILLPIKSQADIQRQYA